MFRDLQKINYLPIRIWQDMPNLRIEFWIFIKLEVPNNPSRSRKTTIILLGILLECHRSLYVIVLDNLQLFYKVCVSIFRAIDKN